jgi:hypothetical protein
VLTVFPVDLSLWNDDLDGLSVLGVIDGVIQETDCTHHLQNTAKRVKFHASLLTATCFNKKKDN